MQTIPTTQMNGYDKNNTRDEKAQAKRYVFVTPAIDVIESDDEILVLADVPGVKAGDLDVQFDKDLLTLVGKREAAGIAYKRTFALSRDVDAERIGAELADGVLTLHLPKLASRKARSIQVKTS